MFDTPVLNVAIGLVFCFAATALAASTLTEALASLVKLRANTLVSGVQKMLNDPTFSGLALAVYNHALVHPQGDGEMNSRSRFWSYNGPSYIKSSNFATALVDVLQETPGDAAKLRQNIDAIGDPQIKLLLQGMYVRAAGDLTQLQAHVASWFDTAMGRVSGTYKRQAQLVSFLAGLLLAVTINVDATYVVTTLWRNPALAREVATEVSPMTSENAEVKKALDQLHTLPVGPQLLPSCQAASWNCLFGHTVNGYNVLGWLITAVASVFGAPFWFDMLQKLVQLRGSGPKPKTAEAAADGA